MDPGGGFGIDLRQPVFHEVQTHLVALGFQLFPLARGGEGGEVVATDQRIHVKAGAACDDGGLAAGDDVIDDGARHLAVAGDGEIFVGLCHIDHVVGDALHLLHGGLGGADVHALVDLHGVAGNHLAVCHLGHFHRQGGFTGSSGAGDANNIVHGGITSFKCRRW